MLADPQVLGSLVTTALVTGTNFSFARSASDLSQSQYRYQDADMNDWLLSVKHQYGKTRNRFTVRVDVGGLIANVLVPAEKNSFSQSCYVVFDCPSSGPIVNTATITTLDRRMSTLIGNFMTAATGADPVLVARIVKGGET
jgi:hypothetical protein